MKISQGISYICIAIAFFSCKNSKPSAQNSSSFTQFPKEENIVLKDFISFSAGRINKIFFYENLLIVRNSKSTVKDNFFYTYDLNTKQLLDSAFKLGSGKNEIMSPLSTGLTKNALWVHDIGTKKILIDSILPQTTALKKNHGKEFNLKAALYSVQVNDGLQLFGNGDYKKESKIQQIDLPSGKVVKEFGKFDSAPNDVNPMSWRAAHESFLFIQPNGKMLVSAYRYADKIELFDLTTFKSKTISGPENYEIEFNLIKAHGVDIIERNEKTRFAFVNGYTTNKYIYLLYSGNNHMSQNLDFGKTIVVYDWKGNPIKKINLPSYVSCFAVKDDKEVYVFDVNDQNIKKADLNL